MITHAASAFKALFLWNPKPFLFGPAKRNGVGPASVGDGGKSDYAVEKQTEKKRAAAGSSVFHSETHHVRVRRVGLDGELRQVLFAAGRGAPHAAAGGGGEFLGLHGLLLFFHLFLQLHDPLHLHLLLLRAAHAAGEAAPGRILSHILLPFLHYNVLF